MSFQKVPYIRTTGFLVEQDTVLLIKQKLKERSNWSFPGGRLEIGETLEQCMLREMCEETGLEIELESMLYVCDRFRSLDHHVVDISFLVKRKAGKLYRNSISDGRQERISDMMMVNFSQMKDLGFSEKIIWLLQNGLPERGSYQGDFHQFYGLHRGENTR